MRRHRHGKSLSLGRMLAELGLASWETIARRGSLMARGKCSPAEYARMVTEKLGAAQRSAAALSRPGRKPDWLALLAPWHTRAKSNARRLRRK